MSLKQMQIPVINNNEFSYSEDSERGIINIFYGYLGIDLSNEDLKEIMNKKLLEYDVYEYLFGYDFKNNSKLGSQKWYIDGNFNIYQNDLSTQKTGTVRRIDDKIIMTKEIVLWAMFKGKLKEIK